MKTTAKPKEKKPRPPIVGYLIINSAGRYMQRGVAGQILAEADAPVQFPKRRAARRLTSRYERQIQHLRTSLVCDWAKLSEMTALLPLTIQPVHAA